MTTEIDKYIGILRKEIDKFKYIRGHEYKNFKQTYGELKNRIVDIKNEMQDRGLSILPICMLELSLIPLEINDDDFWE